MDFSYGSAFAEDSPEAYERLILDVLLGEPSLFPVNSGGRIVLGDPRSRARLLGVARQARPVRVGHLGPGVGVRDAAPHGPGMEAAVIRARSRAMIVDLPRRTTNDINKKIIGLREEGGAVTMGRVLTLVIAPDTEDAARGSDRGGQLRQPRASLPGDRGGARRPQGRRAATGRPDPGRRATRARARSWCCGCHGELADHASSVVMPFLLPDTPVVAWWPAGAPDVPAQDPLGQLAIRRITDATNGADPLAAIKGRLQGYTAGDTDLAWSRITYWRALLASALDQAPHEPITSALVSGLKTSPRSTSWRAGWPAGSTVRCSARSAN